MATGRATTTVLAATLVAFAVGSVVGVGLSRIDLDVVDRLGGSRLRWVVPILPVVPFAVVGVAAIFGSTGERVGIVAVVAAFSIAISGHVLAWSIGSRYADVTAGGEPILACRWEPPQSPKLDVLLLALWWLGAVVNVVAGEWLFAITWAGVGAGWFVSGLVEGRFRLGSTGRSPEVRVHDDGLVRQWPYTRSFVPWSDVDHVRLREGELVLDRGLFDVRLESDDLETPEKLLTAIERQHSSDGTRPAAA
ncbi:PH domain-containing protein [Natronobacterium texcoconense]|nr:PH domain-containing protein [Natronobacterium texcoconense]